MDQRSSHDDTAGLRIHQAIARQLGIAILSGRYQPGDAFGGEIDEAVQHNVSRSAYREAIRILSAKGLVESRPKAGTHVTPRSRWAVLDPDVLAWTFATDEPDEAFVRDLFELRSFIEPAAASLAAVRRTEDHLVQMRAALSIMRTEGLATSAGREADQLFHSTILSAAGNVPLASLASSVGSAITWTTRFKQEHSTKPRDPYPDHLAVLTGIEGGDAMRARLAMEDLIHLALKDMGLAGSSDTPR